MIWRRWTLAAMIWAAAISAQPAFAQATEPSQPVVGSLKPLGQERYQIGRIVVDKRSHRFTVPGRVHALDKPLEYLATSPGGRKAYEALLELDASGSEFNLACILIGLERDPKLASSKPPDVANVVGQRVAMSVAWSQDGQRRQVTAAEALFNADARTKIESVEWVYTGSFTSIDGTRFAADYTGTLISFIRDPTGLIEAVSGIGIGPYGSMRGSTILPPEGSAVELIVELAPVKK
jgi:hypothetical protein